MHSAGFLSCYNTASAGRSEGCVTFRFTVRPAVGPNAAGGERKLLALRSHTRTAGPRAAHANKKNSYICEGVKAVLTSTVTSGPSSSL